MRYTLNFFARRNTFFISLLTISTLTFLNGCGGDSSSTPPPPPATVFGTNASFEAPILKGQYAVGSKQFHWVDSSREEPHTSSTDDNRELLVRVFYPAENTATLSRLPVFSSFHWGFWETSNNLIANHQLRLSNYQNAFWPVYLKADVSSEQGFYPLIIFSHGYGFSPKEHVMLAADLASRGFIVASINHPFGSSRAVFPDGRTVNTIALPTDNLGADLELWSDDQVFVIDQMTNLNQSNESEFYAKLDMSKVGVTGHSYGGAASFHTAWKDDRIKLAIDLDGTIFNLADREIDVPFMFIQNDDGYQAEVFDQVKNDGYSVIYHNQIRHHSFADYPLFWRWDFPNQNPFGPLDSQQALYSITDLQESFMRKYFDGLAAPLLDEPAEQLEFTEVVFYAQ